MLRTKLLILAVALVAIVCTQTVQAYPPAGIDVMNTSARVDLYDPGDPNILIETVVLTGRVVVLRSDPYDPGDGRMKINTVMDTLYMEGYSVSYGDSMYVTLNRAMPQATGYIQQITPGIDFPAESFFDVYYLITIGPPAPNPPKAVGSVRGGFHYDQETGEGEVELKLKAGSVKNAISLTPSGPPDALFQGPLDEEARAKARQCADCPPGSTPEGEVCLTDNDVDTTNGGCNSDPNVFGSVSCGETICGEISTYLFGASNYRDTDWYQFSLSQQVQITVSGCAQFPFVVGFVDTSDCSMASTLDPYAVGDPCDTVSASRMAGPGTYLMFVSSTVYTGYPCGTENDYWAALTCPTQQLVLYNDELVVMADTIWHIPPHGRQYKDPRKIAVYDPSGQIIAYVWHKHVVDPPSGGSDIIPTTGTMPVIVGPNPPTVGQEPDEIIQLLGDATVMWSDPSPEGYVETQITGMYLQGESELFGEAILSASGTGAAIQTGEETFPAESFFDVFYGVQFPELGQYIIPQDGMPVRMVAEIESFPPYNRKYKPGPDDYSPMVDIENPGVIIGWVAPIHWVRPQVGACCDLLTGGCTETTPEDCTDPNELFLGIGVPCDPNPCPPPPVNTDTIPTTGIMFVWIGPIPPEIGQPWDDAIYVEGDAVVSWDEVPGAGIETEIVSMDLTGNSRLFGEAHLTLPSPAPGWVSGTSFPAESFFDVYYEVDLPNQGIIIAPSDSSPHMVAEIDAVPPIPSEYLPDPPYHAIQDIATGGIIGWVRPIHFVGRTCCILPIRGDVNYDGAVNVADLTYLVDYLFFSGQPPPCPPEADVDGSGAINVADLTYLVEFLFFNGPPPAPC